MIDNIHLAQELLRKYIRKRIFLMCILKFDFQRAIDSISWSFLQDALQGFRFSWQFFVWIIECVTIMTFSLAINGGLHGHFRGESYGSRQDNWLKSKIYLVRVDEQVKDALVQLSSFHIDILPLRYLEYLLASVKLKISNYNTLVDTIIGKINSWLRHTLSYASKL